MLRKKKYGSHNSYETPSTINVSYMPISTYSPLFTRMSITIYACSTFAIEDEAFLPTVFYERSTSRQGTIIDEGVHYASIQVGQRFYDTVFPSRKR
jgi:hypothetical protein